MKITFSEGYEPSVNFVVDVERDGVTLRLHALDLVREIAALALRRHQALYDSVWRSVGVVPVDVEDAIRAKIRREIRDALFPLLGDGK